MISLKDIQITLKEISKKHGVGGCEHCNSDVAKFWPSMTAYSTHGLDYEVDGDPNGDVYLCIPCHEEYVEFWQSQWDEYNASRG
jgi:hypothetical protein